MKSERVVEGFGRLTAHRSLGVCETCGERLCGKTIWHYASFGNEIVVTCTLSEAHPGACENTWLRKNPAEVPGFRLPGESGST